MLPKQKLSVVKYGWILGFLIFPLTGISQSDLDKRYDEGNALIEQHKYTEALAVFNAIVKTAPDYVDAYLQKGVLQCMMGDTLGGLKSFDQVIFQAPDYAVAYSNRGTIYQLREENEKALEDFNKYLSLKPDHAFFYATRAGVKHRLNRYQEALIDYNEAIRLQPETDTFYVAKAKAMDYESDSKNAMMVLDECLQKIPGSVYALETRISFYAALEDYTAVVADINRLLNLNPKEAGSYYYTRGRAKYAAGNMQEGCEDLHTSLKSGFRDALSYMAEFCTEQIQDKSFKAEVLGYEGNNLYNATAFVLSREKFTQAIETDPANYPLYYFRARTNVALHAYIKVWQDLDMVLTALENKTDEASVETCQYALLLYGQSKMYQEDYTAAKTYMLKAIEKQPKDFYFYHQLGSLCLKTGDYAGAEQYLEEAIAKAPENSQLYMLMGEMYLLRKDLEKSCEYFYTAKALGELGAFSKIILNCKNR